MSLSFQWANEADDERVLQIVERIMAKSVTLAKSRGLLNRYIYQNYAYPGQDVFEGYGNQSKARLLEI